jgi:LytS/YehU family sensor histidine kinase
LYFKVGIDANLKQTFLDGISIHNILGQIMSTITLISIPFFIKIAFEITRLYSNAYKTERRANQLEIEKLQEETKFLRAQLNPHFLFNTLNNLYGMALKKNEKLPEVILRLSSIMQYILYDSNADRALLTDELAFIKNYVSLEKLRYNQHKKIILAIDETHITNQKIMPLLCFVFIENAFKYGLKSKENGFLEIKIFVVGKIFYFYIVNDKETASAGANQKIGGVGIANIKKRLELSYPDKYRLSVEDKTERFEVKLEIELDDPYKNQLPDSR